MKEATVARRNHAVWTGALISLVGLISYVTFFARFPALRDAPWLNLTLVTVGLTVSAWALWLRRSVWSTGGLALSAICAGLLVVYVFVLSYGLPGTERVVRVGEPAPAFALPDQEGRTTSLEQYRGSSLVLVFYRGFW
jgi:hypothetical protein